MQIVTMKKLDEEEKQEVQDFFRTHGGYDKLTEVVCDMRESNAEKKVTYNYVWKVLNGYSDSGEWIWNTAKRLMSLLKNMQIEEQQKLTELMQEKY